MIPNEAAADPVGRVRLSRLLGADVLAADGRRLGFVSDLRLVQAGPPRGLMATLLVEGIIVGGRHPGSLLGYERRPEQGPWLVRSIVRMLHRKVRYVLWGDVADVPGLAGAEEDELGEMPLLHVILRPEARLRPVLAASPRS
jgi:hypothetical protein